MSRLTQDGTAEPVSLDRILRHIRGQGNVHFPCSADHEQDWQPYPVDPYSAMCDDHTYAASLCFFLLPRLADHVRDWPPCCSFFGLATNTLNVRNNTETIFSHYHLYIYCITCRFPSLTPIRPYIQCNKLSCMQAYRAFCNCTVIYC